MGKKKHPETDKEKELLEKRLLKTKIVSSNCKQSLKRLGSLAPLPFEFSIKEVRSK